MSKIPNFVSSTGMVTIAMNAESEKKEGAWAFIRSLLEGDYQNKYVDYSFPFVSIADKILSK